MTRIGKGKFMQDTVGIDVSKATLDAFWLSGRQHQAFSNDQPGLKLLLRWIGKSKAALTVFEATGVYDRQLQAQLAAHGLPFARINLLAGRRLSSIAVRLGIGLSTLGKWVRAVSEEAKVPAQDAELLRENERLRKENRILREEREVLKKAAMFFAAQKP